MPPLREELLDAHTGNVNIREMRAHIGIAFIGADHELPRLRNGEVHPGQRYAAGQEFLPQMQSRGMCQELRIGIAGRRPQMLMEDLAYFFLFLVYTRQYDMAGRLPCQLDDALAQIGIDYVDAIFMQELVELTLLGEHGLALDHLIRLMIPQNAQHDR